MENDFNPWNDYKRRLWMLLAVLVLGSGCIALSIFTAHLVPTEAYVPIVIGLFSASLVYALVSVSNFKCPRCANPFFYSKNIRNGFTKKCLHCHLPKWATPNDKGGQNP
jgi:hypothetical protein